MRETEKYLENWWGKNGKYVLSRKLREFFWLQCYARQYNELKMFTHSKYFDLYIRIYPPLPF